MNVIRWYVCDRFIECGVGAEWVSRCVAAVRRHGRPRDYERRICQQIATRTASHQDSAVVAEENLWVYLLRDVVVACRKEKRMSKVKKSNKSYFAASQQQWERQWEKVSLWCAAKIGSGQSEVCCQDR